MKELMKAFDNHNVRCLVIRGEPWFVAKDVAEILGYKDTVNAIKQHCKGVVKHHPLKTTSGVQEVRIINEPDLYRLVICSKLPAAEKFESWIVEEVLPSIRKTGKYDVSDIKKKSTEKRNLLTDEWKRQGCNKPYHYINLTRAEYDAAFGDPKKKKAEMTKEEVARLMAFEAMQFWMLIEQHDIGYAGCKDNIENTAQIMQSARELCFQKLATKIPVAKLNG